MESIRILNWGLRKFDTVSITKKDEIFTDLEVWLGKNNKVKVTSSEDFYITIPKRKKKIIKLVLDYEGPIKAPIKKGDVIAKLVINYNDDFLSEHDLLSSENINRKNIISRILNSINYLIWGDV